MSQEKANSGFQKKVKDTVPPDPDQIKFWFKLKLMFQQPVSLAIYLLV